MDPGKDISKTFYLIETDTDASRRFGPFTLKLHANSLPQIFDNTGLERADSYLVICINIFKEVFTNNKYSDTKTEDGYFNITIDGVHYKFKQSESDSNKINFYDSNLQPISTDIISNTPFSGQSSCDDGISFKTKSNCIPVYIKTDYVATENPDKVITISAVDTATLKVTDSIAAKPVGKEILSEP